MTPLLDMPPHYYGIALLVLIVVVIPVCMSISSVASALDRIADSLENDDEVA